MRKPQLASLKRSEHLTTEVSYPTRVGITGSPGTGKKSVGLELARISGLDLLLINEFAIKRKLGTIEDKEFIVDVKKVRRSIDTRRKVTCGHLLPYVIPKSKIDFVAILRCSPVVLRRRYLKRNYDESKIKENLEAEMIGVISSKALEIYGKSKVGEFDTSKATPTVVARRIIETLKGIRKPQFGKIDWLSSQSFSQELIRYSKSDSKSIKDNYG